MLTFIVTLGFFACVVAAMAIGVVITGRRLSGSCGGVPGSACKCSAGDRARCEQEGKPQPHAERPIAPSALTRSR